MRRIFFDTEFTGLHKNTTLVSIGLVSDEGEKFYAELTDFDESQCDEWIRQNVLKNLILSGNDNMAKEFREDNMTTTVLGSHEAVKLELREWLANFGDDIQLISDVCHYGFILLIDLFGTAFDLPKNISASCHDINQDIAIHYGISEKEAFDKSREDIVMELCGKSVEGRKHNALYDAAVIKAIYEEVM